MADIASTDVTITVQKVRRYGKYKTNLVKIAFGNATLTYPSGGVPLPSGLSFGLRKELQSLSLVDEDDASGIQWKYDAENKKLRAYLQGVTVGAAGSATLDDFPLDTTTDPLATTVSVSLTSSTGAGAKYLGKMIEMATSQAPPATVLYGEAIGQ